MRAQRSFSSRRFGPRIYNRIMNVKTNNRVPFGIWNAWARLRGSEIKTNKKRFEHATCAPYEVWATFLLMPTVTNIIHIEMLNENMNGKSTQRKWFFFPCCHNSSSENERERQCVCVCVHFSKGDEKPATNLIQSCRGSVKWWRKTNDRVF